MGEKKIIVLIDLEKKINIINLVYIAKLGLQVWKTNIGAQKIDNFFLQTYGIIITDF